MKTHLFTKKLFIAVLASMAIALAATGCSDDESTPARTAKTPHNPFDHTHDVEVTDIQKHKFEHDFANQCVRNEVKNSVNKEADKEARKFIGEHKNSHSLSIKFDNAAYHCLQKKNPPKGPNFSRNP
jgi:hypothetical protein